MTLPSIDTRKNLILSILNETLVDASNLHNSQHLPQCPQCPTNVAIVIISMTFSPSSYSWSDSSHDKF